MTPTIQLFRRAEPQVRYEAGQPIFVAGEAGEVMYAVVDGEVEIVAGGQVVETVGPGGVVGEMALIDRAARSATVRARTACTVVPIDESRFTFMLQHTPFFALQVMRILVARLRRTNALHFEGR